MFIVLPFSFSSAPIIFTKVMSCLKICVFIDDGFAPPSCPSSLDLVRKKQNPLKTVWLNVALLLLTLKSQFDNHKKNLSGWG